MPTSQSKLAPGCSSAPKPHLIEHRMTACLWLAGGLEAMTPRIYIQPAVNLLLPVSQIPWRPRRRLSWVSAISVALGQQAECWAAGARQSQWREVAFMNLLGSLHRESLWAR